jgi:hypothetical protein
MAFFFDEYSFKSSLEDMANPVVIPVELLGVDAIEMLHPSAERGLNSFNNYVIVVSHEAVGVTKPIEEITGSCKDIEES